MSENKTYRTIFISDVHLGSSSSKTTLLIDFLKDLKTEQLFLVGDIIDLWALKRSWYWPPEHNEVIRRIFDFGDTIPLTYVIGNHEELLRFLVGYQFGNLKICREAEHQMTNGKKLLIIHGDAFDHVITHAHWLSVLGSHALDYLIVINSWLNKMRALVGRPYWSLANYINHQVKKAGDLIEKYEVIVTDEARRRGYAGVVCGHLHVPMIKTVNDRLYMNIGDMVDSCSVLVEDLEGNFSLVYLR